MPQVGDVSASGEQGSSSVPGDNNLKERHNDLLDDSSGRRRNLNKDRTPESGERNGSRQVCLASWLSASVYYSYSLGFNESY